MIGVGQNSLRTKLFIVSGRTALTVAWVPTAMNAGVWMSPCGVRMTPTRPSRPGNSASTLKNRSRTP